MDFQRKPKQTEVILEQSGRWTFSLVCIRKCGSESEPALSPRAAVNLARAAGWRCDDDGDNAVCPRCRKEGK